MVYSFDGDLHTHMDKQRYNFAMSAFVRSYGRKVLNDHSIKNFCEEWSTWEVNAPLVGLNEVDRYFDIEYNKWRGS